MDPNNIDAMVDKAEAHIANEDYQAGKSVSLIFRWHLVLRFC